MSIRCSASDSVLQQVNHFGRTAFFCLFSYRGPCCYCRQCQKADYKHHKLTCGLAESLYALPPPRSSSHSEEAVRVHLPLASARMLELLWPKAHSNELAVVLLYSILVDHVRQSDEADLVSDLSARFLVDLRSALDHEVEPDEDALMDLVGHDEASQKTLCASYTH